MGEGEEEEGEGGNGVKGGMEMQRCALIGRGCVI